MPDLAAGRMIVTRDEYLACPTTTASVYRFLEFSHPIVSGALWVTDGGVAGVGSSNWTMTREGAEMAFADGTGASMVLRHELSVTQFSVQFSGPDAIECHPLMTMTRKSSMTTFGVSLGLIEILECTSGALDPARVDDPTYCTAHSLMPSLSSGWSAWTPDVEHGYNAVDGGAPSGTAQFKAYGWQSRLELPGQKGNVTLMMYMSPTDIEAPVKMSAKELALSIRVSGWSFAAGRHRLALRTAMGSYGRGEDEYGDGAEKKDDRQMVPGGFFSGAGNATVSPQGTFAFETFVTDDAESTRHPMNLAFVGPCAGSPACEALASRGEAPSTAIFSIAEDDVRNFGWNARLTANQPAVPPVPREDAGAKPACSSDGELVVKSMECSAKSENTREVVTVKEIAVGPCPHVNVTSSWRHFHHQNVVVEGSLWPDGDIWRMHALGNFTTNEGSMSCGGGARVEAKRRSTWIDVSSTGTSEAKANCSILDAMSTQEHSEVAGISVKPMRVVEYTTGSLDTKRLAECTASSSYCHEYTLPSWNWTPWTPDISRGFSPADGGSPTGDPDRKSVV